MVREDIEGELVSLVTAYVREKESEVLGALDAYNRGRTESKVFAQDTIAIDLGKILDPRVIKAKVIELFTRITHLGHDDLEKQINRNIEFNPSFNQAVGEQGFKLIKGASDDLIQKLQNDLLEGWQRGEGINELKERVRTVWSNGHFTEARLEMIARTESVRAYNLAKHKAAENSGLRYKKTWIAVRDSRTGPDTKLLDRQVRELHEFFHDTYNKKLVSMPPNRPNCRCTLKYTPII